MLTALSTACGDDSSSGAMDTGGSTTDAASTSSSSEPGTSPPTEGDGSDASSTEAQTESSGEPPTSDTGGEDESTGSVPIGYDIAPPPWMLGMWRGEATDGTPKIAIINQADISFGDLDENDVQLDMTSFASFPAFDPDATFEVHIDDDETYSYTIRFMAPDGPVEFTDTFERVGGDAVEYTFELGGMVVDSFTMEHAPAADFLRPPTWLHGRWEGVSTRGEEKVAVLGPQSVAFGDIVEGEDDITDFGLLLGLDPVSTFRVETPADALEGNYRYTVSFTDPKSGTPIEFVDEYTATGVGSLEYTFELGGAVVDTFAMNLVE
ncbi:MAG: hypothetical protein AAGA54_05300 [Myxococcota bacterium]